MKLNEIELVEAEGFLTGSKIKVFFMTQIGVKITGKYEIKDDMVHVDGDVEVRSLLTKKLPFRFGVVKGKFTIRDCPKLTSLEGCPTETRTFILQDLDELSSLEYCPKSVWSIQLFRLRKIHSLVGMPEKITDKGSIVIEGLPIETTEGLPNYKSVGHLRLEKNLNLTDMRYLPQYINDFRVVQCHEIHSLEGISDYCKGITEWKMDLFRIKKAALGLLLIKMGPMAEDKILNASRYSDSWAILRRYKRFHPDDIFGCQTELIDKGFEDFAQL